MSRSESERDEELHTLGLAKRALQIQRDGLRAQCARLKARVATLEADAVESRRRQGLRGALRDLLCLLSRERAAAHVAHPTDIDWEEKVAIGESHPKSATSDGQQRPRIAVITDTVDWSFANIAYRIEALLSDDFEVTIISTIELGDDSVLALYLAKDHDLIHFLWRESVFEARAYHPESVALYFGSIDAMNAAVSHKTTFTVYDHLFIGEAETKERRAMFNNQAVTYAVCSERLKRIYERIPDYPAPATTLQDGVNLDLFSPMHLERFDELSSRPLRVGWVGNSAWATDILTDSKGFHTILVPALESVAASGRLIEGIYADKQIGFIPQRAMPAYYSKIDVLLCTSQIEGTPNPVLEAMACGVPVVSTDVGIVPEVFGPLQRPFILAERSAECLAEALKTLIDDPTLVQSLSRENISQIQSWSWTLRIEAFRSFFWGALARTPAMKPAAPAPIVVVRRP